MGLRLRYSKRAHSTFREYDAASILPQKTKEPTSEEKQKTPNKLLSDDKPARAAASALPHNTHFSGEDRKICTARIT